MKLQSKENSQIDQIFQLQDFRLRRQALKKLPGSASIEQNYCKCCYKKKHPKKLNKTTVS